MSLEEFLARLKLDQYTVNLKLNGINELNEITEESLARCSIEKIGHKKRILTELKNIKSTDNITLMEESITPDAPALPPKRSSSVKSAIRTPPIPPTRSMSVRPHKPPRASSVAPGGSLNGPSLDSANYHTLAPLPPPSNNTPLPPVPTSPPPIPPRTDRGEQSSNTESPMQVIASAREEIQQPPPHFELPPPPPTPAPRVSKPSPTIKEDVSHIESSMFFTCIENQFVILINYSKPS